VAIFAVTILTALAVAFASIARTDVLLAGNRRARMQGMYAARSGVQYCRSLLAADDPGVDSTQEDWALVQDEAIALDVPGFTVNAVVGDESARLNVNTATREMLLRLPGMTEEAADSILDWRDADDEPRPEGAESDYYLSLPSPYEAANGPFETGDELRLVRGIDKKMFEGDGTEEFPGLRNLVTVRSGEQNVDRQGRRRLNINTASAEQLAERLADVLSGQEIAAIVRRRQQGPFTSLASTLTIEGVSWRKMARALDRICVDNRSFVEGAVNLNTAVETVLEAMGLPPEIAQAIVERRAEQPLETKGDLADIPGVNQEMIRAVADYIAAKSSIFRVTAWAQAEDRPVVSSVLALLDRGSKPAKIIVWREEFGRQAQPASSVGQEGQGSGSKSSGS
jgi:type II secretory pathway component PulK